MKHYWIAGVLAALLLLTLTPVHADDFDADELEAIALVATAFENARNLDTVQVEAELTSTQVISTDDSIVETDSTMAASGAIQSRRGDVETYSITLQLNNETRVSGEEDTAFAMEVEMIFFFNRLYLRALDASGLMAGVLPDEWGVIRIEDGRPQGAVVGYFLSVVDLLRANWINPIDSETVISIEELESTLDIIRIFEVEIDVTALAESLFLESYQPLINFLNLVDTSVEDASDAAAEATTLTMTVWIGTLDELVYRIEGQLTIDLDTADFGFPLLNSQMVETTDFNVAYRGFNQPLTIEPPMP